MQSPYDQHSASNTALHMSSAANDSNSVLIHALPNDPNQHTEGADERGLSLNATAFGWPISPPHYPPSPPNHHATSASYIPRVGGFVHPSYTGGVPAVDFGHAAMENTSAGPEAVPICSSNVAGDSQSNVSVTSDAARGPDHQHHLSLPDVVNGQRTDFVTEPADPTELSAPIPHRSTSRSSSRLGPRYHPYAHHSARPPLKSSIRGHHSTTGTSLSPFGFLPPPEVPQSRSQIQHSTSSHSPLPPHERANSSRHERSNEAEPRTSSTGLKNHSAYSCKWDLDGETACNRHFASDRSSISRHLQEFHGVISDEVGTPCRCRWPGCSQELQWDSIPRHVQMHIGMRWACNHAAYGAETWLFGGESA
ncbi:hypothetical protein BV22DRAFT_1123012 [Leucogyrophana mollusca]|uniref:Uncharacterized protein n=1 Tax=Leucogyrophana mollusca TaxID=85980 RepID=A0ACB8B319_9AGAM|nr:hypothetical protein BV22DRAFT_1123012 [Leucogyrophana mollusca]